MASKDVTTTTTSTTGDPTISGDPVVVTTDSVTTNAPTGFVTTATEFSEADAARIRAEYAALMAQQRARGGTGASGARGVVSDRIQVTRAYQGFQSGGEQIYPGVYFDSDPELYGMAKWLVDNNYAEYMA